MYQQYKKQNIRTDNRKFIPPYEIVNISPQMEETCKSKENSLFSKNPKQWGPSLWHYLHTAAYHYPENPEPERVQQMKQLLCSLSASIPCMKCSKHYEENISPYRPQLDDICSCRDKLFKFLVDLHNKVNIQNGKPTISYNEAESMYFHK